MMDKKTFVESCDLDIIKSVAFTGHRQVEFDFDYKKLELFLQDLIEKGYQNFYIGMAVGFDSICFKTLEKLKRSYQHINLIACIPCLEQDKNFSFRQKESYRKMLEKADFKVLISQSYTPFCMQERNMFMVDNCSLLVCYMIKNSGGTYNTVNYANRTGIEVINFAEI